MTLLSRLFGGVPSTTPHWLEPDQLEELLNGAEPPLVVDVRRPDEFTGPLGHIETARNIPLDQIEDHATELLDQPRSLILVCHTDRRSAAAADYLQKMGATDLAILRGGMVAWREHTA